ncbi:MAG: Glycogen synthase [Syntrophorhabdus sp. PtaB.Bin006]|nr:MAG: Glycogen synthase [Syntrophorhabdus sp. PtaB.Bin006]
MINIHSANVWLPQTQTWMYNIVRNLPKEIEPHIICKQTANLDQFWLPNIHNLSNTHCFSFVPANILRGLHITNDKDLLRRIATRLHAKILHSHFGHIGWADLGVAKKVKAKHVVSFYGFDLSYLPTLEPVWHGRYQELFREVDCVLCEGSFMAQGIANLGCPQDKISLHHIGISVKDIQFRPKTWDPSKTLRVLLAASFQEKKGIPYALEALGRLQRDTDLKITIIGDANNEERSQSEKNKILEVIEKYRLNDKVTLLSYQPHDTLFREAYRHHIFLSPSITATDGDTEGGLPVTILEMAATGMIIVSTTHCDIPEAIHHGSMGLLTEERDVDGILNHIRWLLNNPEKWHDMAVNCRKHIEKEYDVNTQALRLGEIYRGLLQ